jgi:hypothetical protein
MDADGNLYGNTGGVPGASGTIFELSPGPEDNAPWSEKTLWVFGNNLDGSVPTAGLTIDKLGNLYGTTNDGGLAAPIRGGFGTVFELSNGPPPSRDALQTVPKIVRLHATIHSKTGVRPGTVTLRNVRSHGAAVVITGINTETPAFTASQNCLISLTPGKTCKVTVTFTPSDTGKVSDLLNVISNPRNGTLQKIELDGVGK